jgi:hypothetical protein
MHPLLDKYLCQKYPKIFCDRNKSEMESCLHWGLAVGNGWFSLLDSLCSQLQGYIDNPQWVAKNDGSGQYETPPPGTTRCPQVVAAQVKEKFAGLRFYTDGGDDYTRGLVDQAENLSYYVCEECGRMDESVGRNRKGWIRTFCSRHSCKADFTPHGGKELNGIWKQVKKDEANRRRREKWANERWKRLEEARKKSATV